MDKLEMALQEEMQLRTTILKQPIEGLLYDLDLMPEQCKSGTANIRRITVEILRKEIERLRKALEEGIKLKKYLELLFCDNLTTQTNDREWRKIIKKMQQALKERE